MNNRNLDESAGEASQDQVLNAIDRRLAKRNRRVEVCLSAWAGVLDALGWSVAIRMVDSPPQLSHKAEEWVSRVYPAGIGWQELSAGLAALPGVAFLLSTDDIQVWHHREAIPAPSGSLDRLAPLTNRETEVVSWIRNGKTGPEIAIILGCAQRTVESHVARIYRKLGVSNRAELIFKQQATRIHVDPDSQVS